MTKNLLFAITASLILLTFSGNSQAQILKEAQKILNKSGSGFSETDAANAIKEALVKGSENSVSLVSKLDGYYKNPEIKIPFPKDVKTIETKLRSMGMGKQVDKAVESINRAAEDAAKEATPIFVAAIKNMTIADAINIVKGNNNAATAYLQNSTTPELRKKFKPVVKTSLGKVEATRYWSDIVKTYNKIPMVKKLNPDLVDYVTNKAIEGLFIMIAKEELKIRKDPVARTSDLLKKVFGS